MWPFVELHNFTDVFDVKLLGLCGFEISVADGSLYVSGLFLTVCNVDKVITSFFLKAEDGWRHSLCVSARQPRPLAVNAYRQHEIEQSKIILFLTYRHLVSIDTPCNITAVDVAG